MNTLTAFTITHEHDWTWVSLDNWQRRPESADIDNRQFAVKEALKKHLRARWAPTRMAWYMMYPVSVANVQSVIVAAERPFYADIQGEIVPVPLPPLQDNASVLIPSWLPVPPLYATENTKANDKLVWVKLFTPTSSWTWFIVEYNPAEKLAFGYAYDATYPDGAEWGYISIEELADVKGPLGMGVERDLWFKPRPFNQALARLQEEGGYEESAAERDEPPPPPVSVVLQPPGEVVEAEILPMNLERHRLELADGLRVFTPLCVIDDGTLVALQMVGPPAHVKANWAALMDGGWGKESIYFNIIEIHGMKQHVLLQRSLPCGWMDWLLLHKQASIKEAMPTEPFYLLTQSLDKVPPLFFPMLNKALPVPLVSSWTSLLWQWGQRNDLITPVKDYCLSYVAWQVLPTPHIWQELVRQGLATGQLLF